MGFWSTLGKIALPAASIAAAPFTGGSSLLGMLGSVGGKVASGINAAAPMLGAAGAGIGKASQASATNRGEQFGGQMDLAQLLMQRDLGQAGLEGQADRDFFDQGITREAEGRASGNDAWKRLMMAERTLNPGAKPQLAGKYSVAPRVASDGERQGAEAMKAEVMARLQGGNPIAAPTRRTVDIGAPQVDEGLLKAGGLEKTGGILGAILAGLGQYKKPGARQPELNV